MTGMQLYKFIDKTGTETDWRGKDLDELIAWIPFWHIQEFAEMLGNNFLCEGGYDVNLQEDYIALDLVPICEHFGIEPLEILEKD